MLIEFSEVLDIILKCFHKNKYTNHYIKLIKKVLIENRKKLNKNHPNYVYYESHHILPSSIFPEFGNLSKNPANKILLTAKEHFTAHLLLVKSFDEILYNKKMYHALQNMSCDRYGNRINNSPKRYEFFREKWSRKFTSGEIHHRKGKKNTPESKEKERLTKEGKVWFTNGKIDLWLHKEKDIVPFGFSRGRSCQRGQLTGDKNPTKRPDVKLKLSEAGKKRIHSKESRLKNSESNKKYRLYNNGTETIRISNEEILPVGFIPGPLNVQKGEQHWAKRNPEKWKEMCSKRKPRNQNGILNCNAKPLKINNIKYSSIREAVEKLGNIFYEIRKKEPEKIKYISREEYFREDSPYHPQIGT